MTPFGYWIDIAIIIAFLWVFGKPLLIHCWKWWRKTVKEEKERSKNERSKQR